MKCLSLTDLSQKPVPHRNTYVISRSAENILEPGPRRRDSWKRKSCLPSVTDSAISLSYSDSNGNGRPQSCLIDYTSGTFSILGGKQILPAIPDADLGYDSMNISTDSISSLVRIDSIQEKSRDIMRRRHRFVKKRQRESQVFSDDENEVCVKTSASCSNIACNENRRSVHFEDFDIEDENKQKSNMKHAVSTISLMRNNSVQLKSWQIRRHRRAMQNKQKRASRLLTEDFKFEERLV